MTQFKIGDIVKLKENVFNEHLRDYFGRKYKVFAYWDSESHEGLAVRNIRNPREKHEWYGCRIIKVSHGVLL
jgi:hypothetical protein